MLAGAPQRTTLSAPPSTATVASVGPLNLWTQMPPLKQKHWSLISAGWSAEVWTKPAGGESMSLSEHCLPLGCEKKITSRHHERLAIVYVRQSSVHQVQRNQESTQLQYSLVHHAERLGWPRERIAVIDDDLGISGALERGAGSAFSGC